MGFTLNGKKVKMKTEKQIKNRIVELKNEFFNMAFKSDKAMSGGTKLSLKQLKSKIVELNWVLGDKVKL